MKKWEQLMNIGIEEFNQLTEPELRKVVVALNRTANQRMRRARAKGVLTPAQWNVQARGGTFTTRGKNLNQLRAAFREVSNFLGSKTSTMTGYKQVIKETVEKLKERGVEASPQTVANTFSVYEELKARDPWIQNRAFKYSILQEIESLPENMSMEDKILEMQERLETLYDEATDINRGFDSEVSDYFI